MRSSWVNVGLVVAMAFVPRLAAAQCMGGASGGGHDHGAVASAPSGKWNEKKTRQTVAYLLTEDRRRTMLLEALLADAPFMREMIGRIAATPEWRALAAERLAAPPPSVRPVWSDSAAAGRTAPTPRTEPALYRCPMHPDITSARPGNCPKCGMALQRAT